jgi:hypothetical protein
MKITSGSGLTTAGAAGIAVLCAVMWGQISAWWLIAAVVLILSAIGHEQRKN